MSTIKADTLSTLDGTKSITTDRVTQGTARAWVNFNGTGTVAIRASYNVSSITDNGTGQYTVNFTNAMPDINFAALATKQNVASNNNTDITESLAQRTTTACQVVSFEQAVVADSANVSVAIFR